ncbi:Transcriptional regulator BolA [Candidatus Glomeribacter gigasporarum BEG34]|uniref:Transcriptional regulator BolA n=1 Tax=Candidatus Glomeribacter gigasporarum BEG34 TaxID=1070319 RepID=G2J9V8_9BURK|nr:BolA family protein [Candidatus Glomeribacter gigasporarum]CCD29555.1 Transcriptional regulator BolA [Candidatus Glomeribacter gigasporarum BEG34]
MVDQISAEKIDRDALRARIEARLRSRFAPPHLVVEDQSAVHAGHAGAQAGGHLRVLIISSEFEGQTHIARHRKIYEALKPWMQKGIHALSIRALTPEEFSAAS